MDASWAASSCPASPLASTSLAVASGPDILAAYRRPKGVSPAEYSTWRAAIARDWRHLGRAPLPLRSEPRLVLQAVKQDPRAFALASPAARNDPILLREALRVGGGLALNGALDDVRSDRDLVLQAVRSDGRALRGAFLTKHREDREVVSEAVRMHWRALEHAADDLRADREIVLEAVKQNWRALQWVPEELCADREIMAEAVRQDPEALRWAAESLRADPALQQAALAAGRRMVGNPEAPPPRCTCGKHLM